MQGRIDGGRIVVKVNAWVTTYKLQLGGSRADSLYQWFASVKRTWDSARQRMLRGSLML